MQGLREGRLFLLLRTAAGGVTKRKGGLCWGYVQTALAASAPGRKEPRLHMPLGMAWAMDNVQRESMACFTMGYRAQNGLLRGRTGRKKMLATFFHLHYIWQKLYNHFKPLILLPHIVPVLVRQNSMLQFPGRFSSKKRIMARPEAFTARCAIISLLLEV